jgi:glycosyltransferase involved in cell wall biosynthesis
MEEMMTENLESSKPQKVPAEPKKKIRLVFYGDAPCVATGFGKVSSNILPVLHQTGNYEIYCFGVNYMGVPHPYPFQIYPMLPNPQGDPYGREKIQQVLPNMEFDVAFFLQDSFIMTFIPNVINECRRRGRNFRTLAYFPIDGTPWREWIEAMSFADVPVTYTQYGYKECVKAYPEIANKLQVIPHGINTKEFFPLPEQERKQKREAYFREHANKFIVINVNRNQQRKDIPRCMMAFREFKKQCPNSILYLHMAEKDVGWDLVRLSDNMGMKLGEDVLFPPNFNVNTGYPVSVVNDLYNCSDVNISTTQGGGWELSSVEGMATKTPCIFPDNTALTEIFSDGRGFLVRSGDSPNFFHVNTMDNEILRPLADVNGYAKYLKRLYEDKQKGGRIARQMTDKAYAWVMNNLQWDKHIVPKFEAIVSGLVEDLHRPVEVRETNKVGPSDWKVGEVV